MAIVLVGATSWGSGSALYAQSVSPSFDSTVPQNATHGVTSPLRKDTSGSSAKVSTKVTLPPRERTIEVAMRDVLRQAKLQPLYDKSDPVFARRTTVHVTNVPVMEALRAILQGTGITAKLTSDGETVMLRSKSDTTPSSQVQQPTGSIVGRVVDSATGRPISGATVLVVGTKLSGTTQVGGAFQFDDVPTGNQVVMGRILGYEPRTIPVVVVASKVTAVVLSLQQTTTTLSEVVTTATGNQRRVEVANDIAKIDAQKILETAPVRSLTDLIAAAQVPGVQVTPSSGAPGAPSRIRIRGIGSISQNNDPVVIVDGMWINAETSTDEIRRKTFGEDGIVPSRLDDIDPSSIETIEIVRGPSAATLYGQDAANGVIVITTKRGQAGTTRWNFSASRDWNEVQGNPQPKYISFGRSRFTGIVGACNVTAVAAKQCVQDSVISYQGNDPLLLAEGRGANNRYTISVDGGTRQILYAFNGSFQDQLGPRRLESADLVRLRKLDIPVSERFLHPNTLRQTTLSFRMTAQPKENLNLSLSFNGSQTNQRDNDYSLQFSGIDPRDTISVLTLSGNVRPTQNSSVSSSGLIGLQSDWHPITWWRTSLQAGLQRISRRDEAEVGGLRCVRGSCLEQSGSRASYHGEYSVYTLRFQTDASPHLGALDRILTIRPAFGADLRRNANNNNYLSGTNLAQGSSDIATAGYLTGYARQVESATAGWYLNTSVGVFQRIYVDIGLRQDVGSAITNDNALYPKFGVSWLVSNEPFFPLNDVVSTLRFRMAFGHAAVQPDLGDILGRYSAGTAYVNNTAVPTVDFIQIGNSHIEPERATELEAGFDADLFGTRVQASITASRKLNRNNLIDRTLAPSAGVTGTRKENVAQVVNNGFELSLTGRVIDSREMSLTIGTSMTFQENRVRRLGTGVSPFGPNEARIVEGYPIGGLWQQPVLGYADVDSNGYLTKGNALLPDEIILGDSVTYVGWMQPRYSAGYNISLAILDRRLSFNAAFAYQGSYTQYQKTYDGLGSVDARASLAEQAYAVIGARYGNRQTISDLRFTSMSVSFHLPTSLIGRMNARSAEVSLQGSNLGVWTQYRGRDPWVNSTPIGEMLQDDGSVLPPPRRYALVFRVGF